MEILLQQLFNGLVLGSMYALIALGYTMVYGVLNLINFAHGDVLMIGAMAGWTLLQIIGHVAPDLPGIVQLAIAIVGAIPVCIGVSIVIERIAYRRLRNAVGVHRKKAAQRSPRVAAAKAIGAQRVVEAAFGHEGAHALGHGTHVVGGGDHGALGASKKLRQVT